LSSVDDVRHQVQDKWARVSKARQILTNPELRKIYDAGRAKPLSISTSASDITPRRLEEYFLTDEQKGVLERKMKREVEMGERKNCHGEREAWERGERLGGVESDADDGDSTKAVYHSQKNVMAYTRFRTEVSRQRDREWMMGRVGSAEMRKRTPTARVFLPK
jgi:curved DNA-binding protein CbpA